MTITLLADGKYQMPNAQAVMDNDRSAHVPCICMQKVPPLIHPCLGILRNQRQVVGALGRHPACSNVSALPG